MAARTATPKVAEPWRIERWLYRLAFRAETHARSRALLAQIVKVYLHAVVIERQLGGERLLNLARTAAVRWGKWRAPILRDWFRIDPQNMSDLGRAQDWEDRVFGVEGTWTKQERGAATKCETACPFAQIASNEPRICTEVVHALETATFETLNPSYQLLPLERLLSRGDTVCEFRHSIDVAHSVKLVN